MAYASFCPIEKYGAVGKRDDVFRIQVQVSQRVWNPYLLQGKQNVTRVQLELAQVLTRIVVVADSWAGVPSVV